METHFLLQLTLREGRCEPFTAHWTIIPSFIFPITNAALQDGGGGLVLLSTLHDKEGAGDVVGHVVDPELESTTIPLG